MSAADHFSGGPWLKPDEVAELTSDGKRPCRRRSTQCERLASMNIPFTTNYGGRPLVEYAAVLKYKEKATKKATEPNWDAMVA